MRRKQCLNNYEPVCLPRSSVRNCSRVTLLQACRARYVRHETKGVAARRACYGKRGAGALVAAVSTLIITIKLWELCHGIF